MKWLTFSILLLASVSLAQQPPVYTNFPAWPTNRPVAVKAPVVPFRGGVVFWAGPTSQHQAVLLTSTNLLDWQVLTNAPEDGKLRTNYPPVSQQRFYWLVEVPILTNNAGLTLTNH